MCMLLHGDYSRKFTQEHHVVFGTANRRLSERYGLKVYICIYHHEESREAVHKNAEIAEMLKEIAQKEFEQHFPELDFRVIFGKNYVKEPNQERQQDREIPVEEGFILLEDPLPPLDW